MGNAFTDQIWKYLFFHEKYHLNSTDDGAELPSLSCLSLMWAFLDVMLPAPSPVTGFCFLYLDTLTCLFPFFIDIRKKSRVKIWIWENSNFKVKAS